MESGIIADISLSPDEALENPLWPQQQKYHTLLKKSHSVASTSQEHNNKPQTEDTNHKPKPIELQLSSNNTSNSNNNNNASSASLASSNGINNNSTNSATNASSSTSDTITVHL